MNASPLTMPADFRDKLIVALRSGAYKQSTTHLRSAENEFCVHGVALDVLGVKWYGPMQGAYHAGFSQRERLTDSVGFWPVMEKMYGDGMLTRPFPQVADWLEVNTCAS